MPKLKTPVSDLEAMATEAATQMLEFMERTEAACVPFDFLLDKLGALPVPAADTSDHDAVYDRRIEIVAAMFGRLCSDLLRSGELSQAIIRSLPPLNNTNQAEIEEAADASKVISDAGGDPRRR
jgi:hypothetical protein